MKNGLVEERILRREKVVYAVTQKGISTLKAFTEIKSVFPLEEKQVRQVPLLY
jgi:DNA-binding PadR family transcriptional regulator